MDISRLLRHLGASDWGLRRAFPAAALAAIEEAIAASERQHGGEIRFAVEASLNPAEVWRGVTPRQRAIEVFARLHVWDTQHNNGVLIYVSWADRDVEIVADRGFNALVSEQEWTDVCHRMEQAFANHQPQNAVVAGIQAAGTLIARHFPATDRNELPNSPVML